MLSIDQSAETALGDREFLRNKPQSIGDSRKRDDVPQLTFTATAKCIERLEFGFEQKLNLTIMIQSIPGFTVSAGENANHFTRVLFVLRDCIADSKLGHHNSSRPMRCVCPPRNAGALVNHAISLSRELWARCLDD